MVVKINPFIAKGQIIAPPSKSVAHRLLIASALKRGKTVIKNVGDSADVIATCNCLNRLGASITLEDGNATVVGLKEVIKNQILDCNESGSTLRFLLSVSCALGANATFTGSQKLLSRPNGALLEELESHGISIDKWTLGGSLMGGKFEVDASVSSQYVTGLLLALPILKEDSEITLQGKVVSKDYINITLSVLEKAGIKYQKSGNSIVIKGNQEYLLPDEVICEGDWSGSAFPLVLGAIGGEVTVKGLDVNSCQGDKEILAVLKKAGASVDIAGDEITVKRAMLGAFEQDFDNVPDLAPICAVLASFCRGLSVFTGVERLKLKESDRIETTLALLHSAGIFAEQQGGKIIIKGGVPKGGVFDGANDHRIVMSSAVIASAAVGQSLINGSEAIVKSYPEFFKDYKKLGGNADVYV
ncbi:MAG: 3-phosphoshikimate 1-carboxyvinyltransferase [Clostridia bacterium]|nr:3-phosphoshikimate 1-carboxyvinyltransferase [Clostridia bacterium]